MNNVREFDQLKNCSVIEGFLHIIDINALPSEFENLSFPLLTEVTWYVAIVHTRGLKSIGKLFPNLTVIRGQSQLMKGYSFIVFENHHLTDLGLQSLQHISRGAVRIDSNPNLCYADTIDWSKVAPHSSVPFHFIQNNRQTFNCQSCPMLINSVEICPTAENTTSYSFYKDGRHLCWNMEKCQRICEAKCSTSGCIQKGGCCHRSCLGGCTKEDSAEHCTVCRNYKFNGRCVDKCPEGTILFQSRRCISVNDCKAQKRPVNILMIKQQLSAYPYFEFNGVCRAVCPEGYNITYSNAVTSCVHATTTITKHCPGGTISSRADIRKFENCDRIIGSLIINTEKSTCKLMLK